MEYQMKVKKQPKKKKEVKSKEAPKQKDPYWKSYQEFLVNLA